MGRTANATGHAARRGRRGTTPGPEAQSKVEAEAEEAEEASGESHVEGLERRLIDLTASLVEISVGLEARQFSARELLDAHLARVEQRNAEINAVITIDPDAARAAAAEADDRRVAGTTLGPIDGVPITIKDAIATAGLRSTGGAIELHDHVPTHDAVAVARLRAQGAVIYGKTNLPRWSADYQSDNEIFGTTNNPWDLERTPGGSSGGAAAAVAMGFTPFELGTDIGGSVRLPASFCGVYGHKPSFGVVPTHGYLDNPVHHRSTADVNVFGPLARTIDDVEFVFDRISGPSPDDSVAWRLDLPPPRAVRLEDFRIAAWFDDSLGPIDPALDDVHDRLLRQLESAGARIDHDIRPGFDPLLATRLGMMLISSATELSETPDELQARRASGDMLTHRDWDEMRRQRDLVRQAWAAFFDHVDVLLCPVTCVPPFRHVQSEGASNFSAAVLADHHDRPYRDLLHWNALIGSAYLPVTTPPIGRTTAGLPVGMQVVAPYLDDRTSMAFARCIAPIIGGYEPPPLAR